MNMKTETGSYRIEQFPLSRIATIDIGAVGQRKHHIKALIELDVTEARKLIRLKKKAGKKISFNAWLIRCIGRAVGDCKPLQGIRKGQRKVVIFDDVDISIMIEREVEGREVPLPYVIRRADQKSIAEICQEIGDGQTQAIRGEKDYVLGEGKRSPLVMKLYYCLPGAIRRLIWKQMLRNPWTMKRNMGTVMVTSVGMMGRINGWVIPVSVHPLCFAVGSIVKKPGVKPGITLDEKADAANDRIEIREYLYLTALVDHDVVDGAPAARALSRLTKLVESGYGLT